MTDDDHGVHLSKDEGAASHKAAGKRFPTVGIGTSAGGVHALQMLFESMPDDVDAAFVVVVHLDPSRQSELSNILAARTPMPVTQVTGLTRIEPRHVYVTPPNRRLRVTDHHLAITEFDEPRWRRASIDLFFRWLAAEGGADFAIAFSGTDSDGSVGIKAAKEAGGIILVQEPTPRNMGRSVRKVAVFTFVGEPWILVDWKESGFETVEPVDKPRGAGNGRRLIEDALPYQFGARTSFVTEQDGVQLHDRASALRTAN